MENFVHSDDEFLVQSKMESIHLNAIRWSRLKNTTANFFTISFCEFHFLAGAVKNALSWQFSAGWTRVGPVTGTKQFCPAFS